MRDGLQHFFQTHYPSAVFTWQPLLRKNSGVRAYVAFLRHIRRSDVVILAGGTHFQDRYGLRSLRILASHLAVFSFARLVRSSVGFAGVGIGPLHTRMGRTLTRVLLSLSAATLVRDDRSRDLGRILNKRACIVSGFDSAILMPTPGFIKSTDVRTIGISILPYFELYEGDPDRDEEAVTGLAKALEQLHNVNPTLSVRVLVFYDGERDSDMPISSQLVSQLQGVMPVTLVRCIDPEATLKQLGELNALIAMRYHATLLGYIVGCPTLVVSYQDKCTALAEELGMAPSAILQPEDLLDSEHLTAALQALHSGSTGFLATQPIDEAIARANEGLTTFAERLGLRGGSDGT